MTMFTIGIITILLTIRADFSQSGPIEGYIPGRMSPNWPVSALVFMAYYTLGIIRMAGNSAIHAKDSKNAYAGAVAGTLCLLEGTLGNDGVVRRVLATAPPGSLQFEVKRPTVQSVQSGCSAVLGGRNFV